MRNFLNHLTRIGVIIFILGHHATLGQEIEKNGWKLISNDNGIEVFSRNGIGSSIKEIRISCSVKASIENVAHLLSEVTTYSDWVYKCNSSRLIKKSNSCEFIYYITLDFPFPFVDRDLTIESKHWIDPNTGIYHSISYDTKTKSTQNENFVHITEFESEWKISPLGNERLMVEYQSISDPGGDIPLFLVNMVISKGPKETMKEFIRLIESAEKIKL